LASERIWDCRIPGLDPVYEVDSLGGTTVTAIATQLLEAQGIVPTRSALSSTPELSTPGAAQCDNPEAMILL